MSLCPQCSYPEVDGVAYKGIYTPGQPCPYCGYAGMINFEIGTRIASPASGWAGSWPMLGASFVLFLYAAFAVRLLVAVASQKGIGEALDRGASMLAAMQSRGN